MMRLIPVLLLAACSHGAEVPHAEPMDLASRVDFARPATPDVVPITTLPAAAVPAPGGRHDLSPGVDGRLVAWHVRVGDRVEAGAPLATLQSSQLSALSASQSAQSSAIAQAQAALDLARAGAARGVRSAADVQQAEAAVAAARAARSAASRQLAAYDTTTPMAGGWAWRAPVAGVVDAVRCPLGGVQADAVCVSLVATEGVLLEVHVPERHLAALPAPVSATFLSADGQSWSFQESGRAAAIDPHTRSQTLHFAPADPATVPLQGSSGRARLSVPNDGRSVQVPADAVTWVDGEPVVFVRSGQGIEAQARTVDVLGREDDNVVLHGVDPTEHVAVRGIFLLKSLATLEEDA